MPFLLAAIIAAACISIACSCEWFESEKQIQDLFDRSDYVFIGQPIKPLNPAEQPDKRFLGYDVLLKVQALKKGRMTTDTVMILQDESNCARNFRRHETLVVFGTQITQLKQQARNSERPYSELADDGKTFWVNRENKMFHRYQKAQLLYPAVFTSQCVSFTKRHLLLTKFVHAKANIGFTVCQKRLPTKR